MKQSINVLAIREAHPSLDVESSKRIAEAYVAIAPRTVTTVSIMAAESRRAEESSAAGNDLTT